MILKTMKLKMILLLLLLLASNTQYKFESAVSNCRHCSSMSCAVILHHCQTIFISSHIMPMWWCTLYSFLLDALSNAAPGQLEPSRLLHTLEKLLCGGRPCFPSVVPTPYDDARIEWLRQLSKDDDRWQPDTDVLSWWRDVTCAGGMCDSLTGPAWRKCLKSCQPVQKKWAPRESCGDNVCKHSLGQEAFYKCYLTYCAIR